MNTKTNCIEKHRLLASLLDGPDLSSIMLENGHDKVEVDIDLSNNLIKIDWLYRKVKAINNIFYFYITREEWVTGKSKKIELRKLLHEEYLKEVEIRCKMLEETEKYCKNLFDTITNPPGNLEIPDEFRPKKYAGVLCLDLHPALDNNFVNSRVVPILRDISYNASKIIKSINQLQ